MDGTVRVWDLRNTTCQGMLKKPGHHVVAYDPQGVAFCTGSPNNLIKLFDSRNLQAGPFATFKISAPEIYTFLDLQISDNSKYILIATSKNIFLLLDAFTGEVKQVFTKIVNENLCKLGCAFTPDSSYVTLGSQDGNVFSWKVNEEEENEEKRDGEDIMEKFKNQPEPVSTWKQHTKKGTPGPVGCVRWNPRYKMACTASSVTCLWIPNQTTKEG
eukprot:TRINITY_DN3888_c0_g1_i2.p1 TRINITY_DN3888_c0_g1~~TRINITY_DN3888_c0_g1_i2.p1  ORF type:complete len:215 (+),score=56.88 TRINITY_DN3888_c0_g1_i2:499-1143(+)